MPEIPKPWPLSFIHVIRGTTKITNNHEKKLVKIHIQAVTKCQDTC